MDADLLEAAYQSGLLTVRAPTLTALPQLKFLHSGEAESIRLAIELKADWLLMDDFSARQTAQESFAAAGVTTAVKGTLGVIVSAAQAAIIPAQQAMAIIESLKHHPDIWLSPALCDAVIETLKQGG